MNGVPEMLVLQLLSEQPMYGYELVKTIQARSNNLLSFGEGCIYPILHSLEAGKFLVSEKRTVEGRARLYYSVTAKGKKRLAEMARAWDEVGAGVAAVWGARHA